MLRDAAGLGRYHRRLADRVEQRGLAVVDVAHDRDHRRPLLERLLGIVVDDLLVLLVGRVRDRDLAVELEADQQHVVVGQRHRQRHHLPLGHHVGDDLGGADAELLGQVLDRDPRLDLDGPGRHLRLALDLRARRAAVAALTGTAAGLRVDHDPAAATGRGAPLGARLAGGLARLLRGNGGLGAERAAHVVVVDQVVRARGGAGRVKLFLDLSLRDALLAGDVCDRSFCHSVLNSPKPAAPAQPGSAARGRRRRLMAPSTAWPTPPCVSPASGNPDRDTGRRLAPAAAGRCRRRSSRRRTPAAAVRPWGAAGRSRRTA